MAVGTGSGCWPTRPTPTPRPATSCGVDGSGTPSRNALTSANTEPGQGSRGGRPPGFDPARYAQRNTIERGFGRLKQWRGIASRYDKYALVFLGGVLLAAILQYRQ